MTRIGINGFGRMGRLACRVIQDRTDLQVVWVNEPNGDAHTMATLLAFDSVQGRWSVACEASDRGLVVGGRDIGFSQHEGPEDIEWDLADVDIVLECSGRFRTTDLVLPHLNTGPKHVVVSAPVKDGPPNIVVGVNHEGIGFDGYPIVTAASCTTNALAPIVRVLHDGIGIERGVVTTIHNPTNTQSVHDLAHTDTRRARTAQLNLIPTTTNSATAVTMIIPELDGRLDSIAVRVPVFNASLVDGVFHMGRKTTIEEVNQCLESASQSGPLVGILGYETRPLVSSDFVGDPRSAIVDASSTRVTDGTLVKVLAWYDNEWGYANRLVELTGMVAATLG